MTEDRQQPGILVIKHGALGDFVQALGPMKAIRAHHAEAEITLLTTAPYVTLGRACGYFDRIVTDTRPHWHQMKDWLSLYAKLNERVFTRVYDLQNSDRSSFYFRMIRHRPEWVGIARGASHRNISPSRTTGLAFDGHKQTLALAGIDDVRVDTMDWVKDDPYRFNLRGRSYVLLVPGSSPERLEKRWPAAHYATLASKLYNWGFVPVIIGTQAEQDNAEIIMAACPHAVNLTGQTTLTDLVVLGRHAAAAVGNDTGPMHMITPTGCPSLVLFSKHSDPVRHAPLGDHVKTIRVDHLDDLTPETVITHLNVHGFRQAGDNIVFTIRHEH